MNVWNRAIFDALQNRDGPKVLQLSLLYILLLAASVAVAIALVISPAPTAHADEHDDAFIRALKSDGTVPTGDPAGVVAWALWACDQLNQGANKQYVVA